MKHFSFEQTHMNTRVTINVYAPVITKALKESVSGAFAVFAGLENQFSFFNKQSELSRVNHFSGKEIKVSNVFLEMADCALSMAHKSNGAFNPLYRSATHYSKILINKNRGTVRLPAGTVLDLNSIVKGQAIDAALSCFPKLSSVMIEAGGDIAVQGKPDAKAENWSIGIRNPSDPKKIITIMPLRKGAICTSGQYFRDSHIAKANKEIASLTVSAPTARQADVLSTAAYGMPISRAIAFVEEFPESSCLIIDKKNEIYVGPRLRALFENCYEA